MSVWYTEFSGHSYNHCSLFLLWWTTNVTQKSRKKARSTITFAGISYKLSIKTDILLYVNCTVGAEFVNKIIRSPVSACLPIYLPHPPIKQNAEVCCTLCAQRVCSTLRGMWSVAHLFFFEVDRLKARQCVHVCMCTNDLNIQVWENSRKLKL